MVISENKNIKVEVQEWKGKWKVHIRQWYEKDGVELPGKGITLDLDDWYNLSNNIDAINQEILSKVNGE